MSSPLYPTSSLRKKVNPDGAKSAGPLLHGWARRTSRGMVANARQVRALVNYLPTASASVFASLGGMETLDWANKAVDEIGLDDQPDTVGVGEITVLGLPYGGPMGGKDSDGQYFSPLTDFFDGVNDKPPVYFTHGTQNGFEPEPVGKVSNRWYDRRGGWFKLQLDPQSPRYAQLLEANETGNLRASSGVVPASYSADDSTGHINTWLVGEMSLVDLRDGYRPVNGYAVAKATYDKCDTLFTDYYGDPVNMDWIEQLKDQLQRIMDTLSGHKETGIVDDYIAKAEGDLPDKEKEDMEVKSEEKCLACDEAEELAKGIKAEIEAEVGTRKCARCPEAVTWVKSMFKAAKIDAKEAFSFLDAFTKSDETFDTVKAEVEARTVISKAAVVSVVKAKAEDLFIAGGAGNTDPQATIDQDHMNKQRRLVGLPVKK